MKYTISCLVLFAVVSVLGSGCMLDEMQTSAYAWRVPAGPQGDAWAVNRDATHRYNKSIKADKPVMTDGAADFNHVALGDVLLQSTHMRVRPVNKDSAYRLENASVNSRFGPLEDEARHMVSRTIADMYGVETRYGFAWKNNLLEARGTGERIKSWGAYSWEDK